MAVADMNSQEVQLFTERHQALYPEYYDQGTRGFYIVTLPSGDTVTTYSSTASADVMRNYGYVMTPMSDQQAVAFTQELMGGLHDAMKEKPGDARKEYRSLGNPPTRRPQPVQPHTVDPTSQRRPRYRGDNA